MQRLYPEEYELRQRDKLHYRYRGNGGESYLDVVFRLQGVIIEIERLQSHVLLIAHRVIARILLAYFLNLSHHVCPKRGLGLMVEYFSFGDSCGHPFLLGAETLRDAGMSNSRRGTEVGA
jgi:broad specificity phosphatase PhoE